MIQNIIEKQLLNENVKKFANLDHLYFYSLKSREYADKIFLIALRDFNLFEILNENALTLKEICKKLDIYERLTITMLHFLISINLLYKNKEDSKYYITDLTKNFVLKSGKYSAYRDMIRIANDNNSSDFKELLNIFKTDKPKVFHSFNETKSWDEAIHNEKFALNFMNIMIDRGKYPAFCLSNEFSFSKDKEIKLLDVGGCGATYSIELLKKNKNLKASIFELPAFKKAYDTLDILESIKERLNYIFGDFFKNDLPKDYDYHLFSKILHDWNYENCLHILNNSYNSLNTNGKIIVHDFVIDESNITYQTACYSILMAVTNPGRCYTIQEHKDMLKKVGFKNVKYKLLSSGLAIITANK